ncbi:response regulator [Jiulongibacter sp. NS-SX5]|uniref:response regulator n=1 Tax=Jiulongibacter sp. NS-SX5 TaxID=3463854 RepID=UPI00405A1A21
MSASQIRVFLVDDHELVLEGLATLLSDIEGIKVVGKSTKGEEVLKNYGRLQPDIIISDLMMPGLDGFQLLKEIKAKKPDQKIMVLSMSEDENSVNRAISLGADGYILKNEKKVIFESALHAVLEGGKFFSPNAMKAYIGKSSVAHPLTQREIEIATQIASGKSNAEVGEILNISVQTVATHRKNIYRKLDLTNTASLVNYAISQGWIQ